MKIGNREKIVIGVIASLAIIAVLHVLIFNKRAKGFEEARQRYQDLKSNLEAIGQARPWQEIYSFEYETINYELDYYKILKNANVTASSEFWRPDANLMAANAKQDEAARKKLFWDTLDRLIALRDREDGQGAKMSFLGGAFRAPGRAVNNWSLNRTLPAQFAEGVVSADDYLRELENVNGLLNELKKESPIYAESERKRAKLLSDLGMNLDDLKTIKAKYGEVPAMMYSLNQIRLIQRAIPKEELKKESDEDYLEFLENLYLYEWPPASDLFPMYKQIQALEVILNAADTHKLDAVGEVKMLDDMIIDWPFTSSKDLQPAAAQGAKPPGDRFGYGGDQGGGYNGGYNGGYDDGSGGAPPPPPIGVPETPASESVAMGVPINIRVLGSNAALMSFFYEISNNNLPMEVDSLSLAIYTGQQKDDQLMASAMIKVLSHYNKVLISPEQVDEKIAELLRKKAEIAVRPGALELAAKEGFDPASVPAATPAAAPPPPAQPTPDPNAAAAPPVDPNAAGAAPVDPNAPAAAPAGS